MVACKLTSRNLWTIWDQLAFRGKHDQIQIEYKSGQVRMAEVERYPYISWTSPLSHKIGFEIQTAGSKRVIKRDIK